MIRPFINLALWVGYILGVILVWIGFEMYVVDGSRLAPALLSVAAGIGLWAALAGCGQCMRPKVAARPETEPGCES